jgi:ligand-binding SRPBCC domain-containing protein
VTSSSKRSTRFRGIARRTASITTGMTTVEYRSRLAAAPAAVFAFHERPEAFTLLAPPWEAVRVVSREGRGIEAGVRVVIETRVGPLWLRWVAVHERLEPGVEFVDRAESGPFRAWRHVHRVEGDGAGGAWLIDRVTYELPLDALARPVAGWWVRRKLDRMFAYRHQVTGRELGAAVLEGVGA